MTYHLFRVMCQLYHMLITCYPRKHGRRSGNRFSIVICSTSYMSHLWHATERDRVDKGTTQQALAPRQTAAPEAGPVSKGMILYAIRSLKINGVEINRSACRHAQTARCCRTRRVHSSIHTAAPTRRIPLASTENTSRGILSVPDEPDAVDAVCTRAARRVNSMPVG